MSRFSRYAALAVMGTLIASSGAYARTNHIRVSPFAGAYGAVNGPSDLDIRRQCFAEARQRWPSMNQDMQRNREFTYQACAADNGINP